MLHNRNLIHRPSRPIESGAMPWPLVPRRALDRVFDVLSEPRLGGVALLGNEGVGKSTLAAQVAERLGLGEPLWVIGTLAP